MYRETAPDRLLLVVEGSVLMALQVESGERAWELELSESDGAPVLCVVGDRVLVLYRRSLCCVSRLDGDGLWKLSLPSSHGYGAEPRMVVHERRVYVSAGRELHCVALDTGELRWSHEGHVNGWSLRSFGFEGNVAPVGAAPNTRTSQPLW